MRVLSLLSVTVALDSVNVEKVWQEINVTGVHVVQPEISRTVHLVGNALITGTEC